MKNLLALVGLVVVGFAAAGWYLGWYKIGKQTDATGKTQLNIQVDPNKVQNDLNKAKEKASNFIEQQGNNIPPMPPMPPVGSPPWGSNVPVPPPVSDLHFPPFPPQPPSAPPFPTPTPPPQQQSSGWLIPW